MLRKDYKNHLHEESFNHSIIFIEGQKRKNKEIEELKGEICNLRKDYDVEIKTMFLELNRVKLDMAHLKSTLPRTEIGRQPINYEAAIDKKRVVLAKRQEERISQNDDYNTYEDDDYECGNEEDYDTERNEEIFQGQRHEAEMTGSGNDGAVIIKSGPRNQNYFGDVESPSNRLGIASSRQDFPRAEPLFSERRNIFTGEIASPQKL